MQSAKSAVEKMSNWAGATPLFRLSAAPKYRGIAPALRHQLLCLTFFSRQSQDFETQITEGGTPCQSSRKLLRSQPGKSN